VPCSVAASISSPSGKSTVTSSDGARSTTTTTTTMTSLPGSRARRPSTLQYCLKSSAATPRLAPPPATPPDQPLDDRPPDQHEVDVDRSSTALPPSAPAVWPTKIVAPKATPEDSLIDSCSTDGDDGPEYRLLSLTCDELIGDHLRATANTSHLDLLNRPLAQAAPTADEDDDVDDDDFDLSEGRPVELCRDELPPESLTASAAADLEPTSPDPFRYVDVLAARSVSVVNSCDATGFPRRRHWSTSGVGSGTSLPARLLAVTSSSSSLAPRQARSSTLPRTGASLLQPAADSSSDTLTPCGSLAAGTVSTLTKKRSLTLSVGEGGAVAGGSAGRLTATSTADSPTATRLSPPDSPVSRFCHLGAHALDVFYSPADDDDDDVDDAGVVSGSVPVTSTAASSAGTFWRPVACTAAVDRRRRPASPPPSLSQLITLQHSPPQTYRRPPRLSSHPPAAPPTMRPSAAPLVGLIEGFSDIDSASISDDEQDTNQTSTIRPPPPTGLIAAPSASAAQPSLRQSSRSCTKHEAAAPAGSSESTWLTTPAEASAALHRDSHSPATDTVWPAETLRPRYTIHCITFVLYSWACELFCLSPVIEQRKSKEKLNTKNMNNTGFTRMLTPNKS